MPDCSFSFFPLVPPTSLALTGDTVRKKRLVAPTLSLTLDKSSTDRSMKSDEFDASALSPSPDDDLEMDINLEALETPSDSESFNFPDSMHGLEWEGIQLFWHSLGLCHLSEHWFTTSTVVITDDLPRMGKAAIRKASLLEHAEMGHLDLDQVDSNGRRWRRFHIGSQDYQVNMSVLEPYLQVLSHGGEFLLNKLGWTCFPEITNKNQPFIGYYGDGSTAIIMFTSCYLPENTTENYEYVMDNLFR